MLLDPKKRKEGTKTVFLDPNVGKEGTKNRTTVQKTEQGYIRQNRPFAKLALKVQIVL